MKRKSNTVNEQADALAIAVARLNGENERFENLRTFAEGRKLSYETPKTTRYIFWRALPILFLLVTPGFLPIFQGFWGNHWTGMVAFGFAVTQIALATYYLFYKNGERLLVKRTKAGRRLSIAPILTLIVAVVLTFNLIGPLENAGFFASLGVFALFICFTVQWLVWLPIIDFGVDVPRNSSNCTGDKWAGLDSITKLYEQSQKSEKRREQIYRAASVAFTILTTLSLNTFTLIGSLRHPGWYFVIIACTWIVVFFFWKGFVDLQKGTELQFGNRAGEFGALFLIIICGCFNFAVPLAITVCGRYTWIDAIIDALKENEWPNTEGNELPNTCNLLEKICETLNSSDFVVFTLLASTVIFATVGPILAAEVYRSKTSFEFDTSTVTCSLRGTPIFFIDQANCRVRSLVSEGRIRPSTIWLPVDFVTSQGKLLHINMKWTAWGIRKNFTYRYKYSIVRDGKEIFLLDSRSRWTYFWTKAEAMVMADNLLPREECRLKVRPAQRSRSEAESLPVLNVFGIPPYIPPTAMDEAAKGKGTKN
ncbi:hypothetical protein ACKFRZ_00535 [Corynebacterium gottingense]|uniref:hypothetical protein n=1 Tax=Corynebacterium TaxID=1716 RepID=UPI0010542183|nr:hypothetical protein [Corynebacterium hadale]